MTTVTQVAQAARMRLRDFGHFFEAPYTRYAPMVRLPHPLIDVSRFSAWQPDGTIIPVTEYTLDGRNGVMQTKTATLFTPGFAVAGYYYEWFMPEDLEFHAASALVEILSNQDMDVENVSGLMASVTATYAVTKAWWSLLSELALDIDVSTPEGMSIPASQRFRQVWEMANFWYGRYKEEAALAGVGLYAIEQFNLRRLAKLTNRYVPIFKPREIDDPTPPLRLLPEIEDGVMAKDEAGRVAEVYMPQTDIGIGVGGGWQSIGYSGAP